MEPKDNSFMDMDASQALLERRLMQAHLKKQRNQKWRKSMVVYGSLNIAGSLLLLLLAMVMFRSASILQLDRIQTHQVDAIRTFVLVEDILLVVAFIVLTVHVQQDKGLPDVSSIWECSMIRKNGGKDWLGCVFMLAVQAIFACVVLSQVKTLGVTSLLLWHCITAIAIILSNVAWFSYQKCVN